MTRFLLLAIFISIGLEASSSVEQTFTLTGHISGLQKGDTLRFERIIHPGSGRESAFDIIVEQPDSFAYAGKQKHDQHYMLTYFPKAGSVRACARTGKTIIITDGDSIRLSGTTDNIYYCTLGGGIYNDPLLSKVLQLEDSLGIVRSSYLARYQEAFAKKDTVTAMHYINLFNNFGRDGSNHDSSRIREAQKNYDDAHPEGSLYRLINSFQKISYIPLEKSRSLFDSWSQNLKDSYYGRLYSTELSAMEHLADGQPSPEFSAFTTDSTRITANTFKGRYLLIYHWGMCPGSLQIDAQVCDLYKKYSNKDLVILGLTESLDSIRQTRDGLSENEKYQFPGVDDLRTVLSGMLQHPWKEVEIGDEKNENALLTDIFRITGMPFFIFIDPEGKIRARGFSEAFFKTCDILDKELDNKSSNEYNQNYGSQRQI